MRSVRSNIRLYKFLGVVKVFLGFVIGVFVVKLVLAIYAMIVLIGGES